MTKYWSLTPPYVKPGADMPDKSCRSGVESESHRQLVHASRVSLDDLRLDVGNDGTVQNEEESGEERANNEQKAFGALD